VRILFVCMPGSVHSARWIGQLAGEGWDVHVYGALPTNLHVGFRDVTVHSFSRYRPQGLDPQVEIHGIWPFARGAWHAGMPFAGMRPRRLARLVERLRPDVVHSLEFQSAGYLTLAGKRLTRGGFPPWIATCWGSDINWFSRFPDHEERIRAVLSQCDLYLCECHRDVALARRLGLTAPAVVTPSAGGIDAAAARRNWQPGPVSSRRMVVVKGYENWHGRGLIALRAVELAADVLDGIEVVVTLAAPSVASEAEKLRKRGINVTVLPTMSHAAVMALYGQARVSLALSAADGLSTSTLEAVAMGAFPVQSRTSCLGEWVDDGKTGFLVEAEDPELAAEALRRALTDDALVDTAAERNAAVVRARLDESVLRPRAVELYRTAVG
jgi:glycosyltransferase involved in cell wall biosynthesis